MWTRIQVAMWAGTALQSMSEAWAAHPRGGLGDASNGSAEEDAAASLHDSAFRPHPLAAACSTSCISNASYGCSVPKR